MKKVLILRYENKLYTQFWAGHYLYNYLLRSTDYEAYIFKTNSNIDFLDKPENILLGFSPNIFKAIYNYYSVLRKIKPDIVHISAHPFSLIFLFITKFISYKSKLCLDIRSLTFRNYLNFYYKIISVLFDHTFCLSTEILEFVATRKKSLLPVGFDSNYFNVKSRDPIEGTFIWYGSITKKRQLGKLIDAFYIAKRVLSHNVTFLMAGPIADQSIIKKAMDDDILDYLGNLNIEQLTQVISKCKYGLAYIPNTNVYQNNLPLKTIEMLAAGLQVIATNTMGNLIVCNNENFSKIVEWNSSAISDAIIAIMNEKVLQVGNHKDISLSVQNYSWKNVFSTYLLPIYNSL